MKSMGQYLQGVRTKKGICFEDVVSRTRINPIYVKALEEDNLGGLPNQVFAKGFLRAYLQVLSINEKTIFERYSVDIQDFFSPPNDNPIPPETHPWRESLIRQFKLIGQNGYGALLIIICSLSFLAIFKIQGGEVNSSAVSQVVRSTEPIPMPSVELSFLNSGQEKSIQHEDVLVPDDVKGLQMTGEATEEESNNFIINPSPGQASREEPHSLFIEALEQSWILVLMDDNEAPKEIILEEGEEFIFYAKEKFLVTLGNAGGVHISLNGETLESFGKSGQVVRDILLMAKEKKKSASL